MDTTVQLNGRNFMYRVLVVMAILLVGCGKAEVETVDGEARGAEALRPLKSSLQTALLEGLSEGPEGAIAVCRERAPELAAQAGGAGVLVGRTSHKLRNPDNAPKPWMRPLLNAYVADPADTTPRVVDLPDGGMGYVEPIYVKALCLGCHGETVAPSVEETIAELYPEDQATGFEKGDFRGLFWVEFAASD
jgi:hypothetical protein